MLCVFITALADFQYLPMIKNDKGEYESKVDQLVLKKMEPKSWLDAETPLFIPPPIFSRIDKPVDYCYRDAPKSKLPDRQLNIGSQPNFIGISEHFTMKLFSFNG